MGQRLPLGSDGALHATTARPKFRRLGLPQEGQEDEACPALLSVPPVRALRSVHPTGTLLSRSLFRLSFPSPSRSHRQGLSGCMKSNWTDSEWRAHRQWSSSAAHPHWPRLTNKYPSAIAALANVRVKTAYIDGELCGIDEAGMPSFAQTQAATDGERGVHLVYYAFDLLHLGGWDVWNLQLIERKALLEPLVKDKLAFNSMVMRLATASLS